MFHFTAAWFPELCETAPKEIICLHTKAHPEISDKPDSVEILIALDQEGLRILREACIERMPRLEREPMTREEVAVEEDPIDPVETIPITRQARIVIKPYDGESLVLESVCLELAVFSHWEMVLTTPENVADGVRVRIVDYGVQHLALLCSALLPGLNTDFPDCSIDDAYRLPATVLKNMRPDELRLLIRDVCFCGPEIMADYLWYMDNRRVTTACFAAITQRDGKAIQEEIQDRWCGLPVSAASPAQLHQGRAAVSDVLYKFRRLIDEGHFLPYA